LKETEQENLRLRKLLQFQEKFKIESVVGRVIAKDVSSEFRTIRINRGELSGIRKDMAVITDDGIVGRVLRTTGNTADVVTMLDLLSAVDSIDERSRARGVVEGLTDDTCEMRYTVRTDDIQPGDVLVTSGLGGIFPKGIPVGVVSRVDRKQFGITQKVEVRPSVDFRNLEEVTVVLQVDSEPVLPQEKTGDKTAGKAGEKSPERSHKKDSSAVKTPESGEHP
jgi:rod shape-determining protein MreC